MEELQIALAFAKEKLKIAEKALNDIANWNDELEEEWEDAGYRAIAALKQIKNI